MSSLYNKKMILNLEDRLNIRFKDRLLLQRAVTHKSFSNENKELNLKNNERLEFLGDSVLSLTISTFLFRNFPDNPEGDLAKMRAVLVSAPVLADKARELNLGQFILLGHGEEITGGRERDSILADTMEAVLGAIYLDHNFNTAADFIINIFQNDIKRVVAGTYIQDYKTMLQELIQKGGSDSPSYSVIKEKGPDHNKTFVVQVEVDAVQGIGSGSSKKDAEQQAARDALKKMREL